VNLDQENRNQWWLQGEGRRRVEKQEKKGKKDNLVSKRCSNNDAAIGAKWQYINT
jgi:hypothetical protein